MSQRENVQSYLAAPARSLCYLRTWSKFGSAAETSGIILHAEWKSTVTKRRVRIAGNGTENETKLLLIHVGFKS